MKYSEISKKEVIDSTKPIIVDINDIPKNSHIQLLCECDNCKKQYFICYNNWTRRQHKNDGDFCKDCMVKIKLPQYMLDKYGVKNCANLQDVMNKKKHTNLLKYGNEWAIASDEVKQKITDTMLKKYGVDNAMKNIEVQNKAKSTNILKYGGNSPMCDDTIKNKFVQTCLNKYGVQNPYQCKDIQAKAKQTLCKNQNVPSSNPERELCKILKEMFGESNCYPNYPVGNLSLDCYVCLEGHKIDFEYDGIYWHKNRGQIDAARNAILMNNGYKIIRVKANNKDTMPTKLQIQNAVEDIIYNNKHLVFINMNI